MIIRLLHLLRGLPMFVRRHRDLALENPAQRQQIVVDTRALWAFRRSNSASLSCPPDTVLRWQRPRFRQYWTRHSALPTRGRLRMNAETATLASIMFAAYPCALRLTSTGNS